MSEIFKTATGELAAWRKAAEYQLWLAQLANYSDSKSVSHSDALRWLDEPPQQDLDAEFDRLYAACYPDAVERRIAKHDYVVDRLHNHRLRIARAIAMTIQYEVGVFYECGLKPDGTYRWRGFRYGIEGSQYLSGFSRE